MNINQIIENDQKYYMNTFGKRLPVAFVDGAGSTLTDTEGKKYTDLFSGIAVNILGHNHPKIVEAITTQAQSLIHSSNYYYNVPQTQLAKELVESTNFDKVFFTNSGAESNEGAIKLARGYFYKKGIKNKYKVISFNDSFHGRTLATVAATGQEKYQKPFSPLPEGFIHVNVNDSVALANACDDSVCAIIFECIMGEGGVIPLKPEFIETIKEQAQKHHILLICDEVQTGFARTGSLFAHEQFDIKPDIMTTAKAIANGLPMGALLATNEAATGFEPGDHGTTFGGNPMVCHVALAVLEQIKENALASKAKALGEFMTSKLNELKQMYDCILDVRGKGLMIGIQFSDKINANEIKNKSMEKGYLVGTAGNNTLRLLPPLIITEPELASYLTELENILKEID